MSDFSNMDENDLFCVDEVICCACGVCTTTDNTLLLFSTDPQQSQQMVFDNVCLNCIYTDSSRAPLSLIEFCNQLKANIFTRRQDAHDLWEALNGS
jgi:hypothetical protein